MNTRMQSPEWSVHSNAHVFFCHVLGAVSLVLAVSTERSTIRSPRNPLGVDIYVPRNWWNHSSIGCKICASASPSNTCRQGGCTREACTRDTRKVLGQYIGEWTCEDHGGGCVVTHSLWGSESLPTQRPWRKPEFFFFFFCKFIFHTAEHLVFELWLSYLKRDPKMERAQKRIIPYELKVMTQPG